MIAVSKVQHWLAQLPAEAMVAVDEGGLSLIDVSGKAYLEIGGFSSAKGPDTDERSMTAAELKTKYDALTEPSSGWSSHPEYPRSGWEYEVANEDTSLGYWEWVAHEIEMADDKSVEDSPSEGYCPACERRNSEQQGDETWRCRLCGNTFTERVTFGYQNPDGN